MISKHHFTSNLKYVLNNDCLLYTLSFLNVSNIKICLFVNKQFNTVAKNSSLWKPFFANDFYNIKCTISGEHGFYDYYRKYNVLGQFLKKNGYGINCAIDYNYIALTPNTYHLPDEIGLLCNLQTLTANSRLCTLPHTLSLCTFLQCLYLNDNKFTVVPEVICHCTSLVNLDLSCNEISILPESIKNCKLLQYVNLNNNKLGTLPKAICELIMLKTLNLERNNLVTLPQEIENLTMLEYLDLTLNKLQTIPETIGNISTLKSLLLGRNKLRNLPCALGQLHNLERLDIYLNLLRKIPKEIFLLPSMRSLGIDTSQRNLVSKKTPNIVIHYSFF